MNLDASMQHPFELWNWTHSNQQSADPPLVFVPCMKTVKVVFNLIYYHQIMFFIPLPAIMSALQLCIRLLACGWLQQ